MSEDLIAIIDAIAVDLTPLAQTASRAIENASGEYLDWRYLPPKSLTAESAPWLAIWSPGSRHTLLGTSAGAPNYMDLDQLIVEWSAPIGQEVETPENLSGVVRAAELAGHPILEQLRTYASGLPTPFDNQFLATLISSSRDTDTAMVFSQAWTLGINRPGLM